MAVWLSHLFMHVGSLAASRTFYADQLGLEVLAGSGEDGSGYMRIGGDNGFSIGMEERPAGELGSNGIEVVIRVDDVDATYARLRDQGVDFDGPPTDQPWGNRHCWLRDPDGYRLSLYSVGHVR